ncbi:uncharacterized protein BDZ99DRAFT_483701 [Mytilinidion resinicola]|uniref:Uncharacterized protein n=1 Tax=Mytilinidion resinicola TaxID=574789 RepID=A0A6A6XZR7_9PEZI|nr:uncharacterized protein BDZ99DRAFT_483701 [Mytilinidion resinicola]KAF2801465.1 hypothetical protein BDZ99DRAFT_483701 [Mytilinidion resinicola]
MDGRAGSSSALEILRQQPRVPGHAFIVMRSTFGALCIRDRELPREIGRQMLIHYMGGARLIFKKDSRDLKVAFTEDRVVSTGPGGPKVRMARSPGSLFSEPVIIAHHNPHAVESLIFNGWELDPEAQLGACPVYKWGQMRVILITGNPTVVFQHRDTATMVVVGREQRIQLNEARAIAVPLYQTDVPLEWTREIKVDDFATEIDKCAICYQTGKRTIGHIVFYAYTSLKKTAWRSL